MRSGRRRLRPVELSLIVAVAVVGILTVTAAAYAMRPAGHGTPLVRASIGDVPISPTVSPTQSPSPTQTPSASPSAVPSSKAPSPKAKPKPKPSVSPKPVSGPTPPPVPPASPPGTPAPGKTCPYLAGTPAAKADVQAALVSSAGTDYWGNGIKLRPELVEAVGWEESGWQSTIMSCDGGTGTMQVMAGTADWMNQQCGTHYALTSLTGNIAVGSEYLEWLVRYFGNRYFNGNYSLAGDPNKLVLLDAVIAAYQQGFGVIDNALTNQTDFPNWWYVYAVEGFMTNRPWTATLTASPSPAG